MHSSYVDFRSIRFPGIISSNTIPSAGTSDYIPDMLHTVGKGEPYNCFVRENTKIPFMTMPDAIAAILKIMSVPRNNLNHSVYNIRSFAPTAEEFQKMLITFFPDAKIKYKVNVKKQKMIDSWPEDTNDNAAKRDWNWQPQHDLESGLKDYLIPGIIKKYK